MEDREREPAVEEQDSGRGPLEALKDYAEHAVKVLEPQESDVRVTPIEPDDDAR